MNSWILDVLDTPVRETLVDRDNVVIPLPGRNNDAKDLQRKMNVYLYSGKEQDFRSLLSTIVSIAKNRLRRSAKLLEELEGLIRNDNANLLVSVETEVFVKDIYKETSARLEEKGLGKFKKPVKRKKRVTRAAKSPTLRRGSEQLANKSREDSIDTVDTNSIESDEQPKKAKLC